MKQPSGPTDTQIDSTASTPWYRHAMEQLIEVVQQLSMARDLKTVMDIVRQAARNLTGADGSTFVLRDGDKCFYAEEDAISPLWKGQRFPMNICISGWVMLNRMPAVIEDIYADPRIPADAYRPTFVRSLAMVPIRTMDPVGAIGNYWARTHRPTSEQVKLLQALADTTAVAMENVRIYEELEQRVRERTSEVAAILDNVQAGIVFIRNGQVVRANRKAAEIFGFDAPRALLSISGNQLFQPEGGASSVAERAKSSFSSGSVFDTEARLLRHDQSGFWAHLVAKTLDMEAESQIWMVDDISVVKEKEALLTEMKLAAEESTRFKSEFLASMSHELRTPLNAVIGFSEVMRDGLVGQLSDKQHEYVCDIFDSGQHLLSLINDVLDLSKVEAGKMVLEAEETDVGNLLTNSLTIVKEKSLAHRITLHSEVPASLGMWWLDPRKVKQIIYNLLSNAVKFTPEGGTVTLRAGIVDRQQALAASEKLPEVPMALPGKPGRFLAISVSDTGIGISAEDLPGLFQPFVQIDSALSRQFEGTGLGLALVRKLAELHGGSVAVTSQLGKGSQFTVWLPPRPITGGDGDVSVTAHAALPWPNGKSPSVLVVEDDDRAADLIRLQLETDDCQVRRAASAEAALAMLDEGVLPDLISLDILLPGMDGWEFLAKIKENRRTSDIPVVIISILAECGKGLSLGAAEVLQKPVLSEELCAALKKLGVNQRRSSGQQATALVIDDDCNVVEIISSYLGNAHFNVLSACGGADGIRLAQEHAPDLIILDLMMPECSGFEVVETLKLNPKTADIPILVLTAKLLTREDRDQLNGHVRLIMEKSEFNHGNFLSEVRRALAGKWRNTPVGG